MSPSPASAQLSPGKLSRPHAQLEGLTKCSNCHKLGSKDLRPKCLECHREIEAMVEAGRGLHAAPEYRQCETCHVEHVGEDADLIYWPDGQAAFDHRATGTELTGSHAALDCRKCHTTRYVVDAGPLRSLNKDLTRTFLGLENRCEACHADIHEGQFKKTCTECHDTGKWKPAPLFEHAASRFPLTGKHVPLDCAKCHKPVASGGGGAEVVRFANIKFQLCSDCHKDPHVGTLGPDCAGCHTTEGWRQIAGKSFDHGRTRYPLQGRHKEVKCAGCHAQERGKPAFAACTDCHRDEHNGKMAQKPALLVCEACHTVDGFVPSTYTMTRHETADFPLRGAHQATPCSACHKPEGVKTARLTMSHKVCTDCHRDPHQGKMERLAVDPAKGCAACHTQDNWRMSGFEHEKTGFVLDGGHRTAACAACHRSKTAGDFTGLEQPCAACHEDIHKGQFAERTIPDGKRVDCAGCHVTTDWFAEKFNHEKDSRFPLRGGHERVPCTGCHVPVSPDNERLLVFKPLPTDCKDCHAGALPGAAQKEKS